MKHYVNKKKSYIYCYLQKLHGGEIFKSSDSFPSGLLPTKRQVIERMLSFDHFRKLETARIIAKELHDVWVWCNVYSIHELSIAQKVNKLVLNFSVLTRYPKKAKSSDRYKEREANFMQDVDKLFDIFCYDKKQRRQCKI